MEVILAWQLVVAASIAISRTFSSTAMIAVALFWTAWTFLAIWAGGLMVLQLGTAWGTVWLLSSLFGERAGTVANSNPVAEPQMKTDERHAASEPPRALVAPTGAVDGSTAPPAKETKVRAATAPATQSVISSVLDGVTNVANATTTALQGFNKALDDINGSMQRQTAKMVANQEILEQLYGLRLSVESVLRIAEKECETQRKLAADPNFAKIYWKLKEQLGGASSETKAERRAKLQAVTAAPQRPDELPPLAADERAEELTQCRKLLQATMTRITRDGDLLKEIEKLTETRFLLFLLTQDMVLSQHLKVLSPQESSWPPRSIIKSRGADDFSPGESSIFDAQATSPLNARQPSLPRIQNLVDAVPTASGRQEVAQGNGVLDNTDQGRFLESTPPPASGQRERQDIESFARELGIPHLVHFTRCENLAGILNRGLMSIATCDKEGHAAVRNDMDRWDGQPDGISLSIAFPNYRMFYKYRQIFRDADWAVLLISPRVLWEKECAFYRYNAADARVSREQRDKMKSLQAFRDMFADDAGTREASLRRFDPSDPQAEILVYETIPHSYIEAVAFETREARTKYMGILGGLESFYAGPGKGLFGARFRARGN